MKQESGPAPRDEDRLPTRAEIDEARRNRIFARPEHSTPDQYPRLWNISAAHMYTAVPRATRPEPPEYVTVVLPESSSLRDEEGMKFELAITEWNLLWEAAQFRRRVFDHRELPSRLEQVADQGDNNVIFVPRSRSRYHEYSPLFHLLPQRTIKRFRLPLLSRGQWPFFIDVARVDDYLPHDFEERLSTAWATTVWRHLLPGSPMHGFSKSDPIQILAHNMDFWLPPVTEVIQSILREFPEVDNGIEPEALYLEDGTMLEGVMRVNPRVGSDLWRGEEEAAEMVARTVQEADSSGRLRGILDAVRSHRVADDFSDFWTFEREDFERKIHHSRSKRAVKFVELPDRTPVQSPETEVVERMVFGDFFALLDRREREVVVLLHSGTTKLTDVAVQLGYQDHSAISKRLARIREKATRFFDELD